MCAVAVLAACATTPSATDLHPEGPPMIEQVRLSETYDAGASNRIVFGFGSHPLAMPGDAHAVTSAKADGNRLRIVVDELLRGNNLEEILCRYLVDDDMFARVPLGATPDDIARCSVAQDVLPSRCPGSNKLSACICQRDLGCAAGTKPDGTANIVPKGESVGVLDANQDGAADKTQFIAGAANITCGGIDVPTDVTRSYWTPSGNQQKPAQGGFEALGPAIVLVPLGSIPTRMQCGIKFASDVVDKDGNRLCAPAGGDLAAGCTAGDTSAITFTVEPLLFVRTSAAPDKLRKDPVTIDANAGLDPASLVNITITEGAATPYTQFTATLAAQDPKQIIIRSTATDGFAAMTQYTIDVPITVTDAYKQPPTQPYRAVFSTGAN